MVTSKTFVEESASARTTRVCTRKRETFAALSLGCLLLWPACQAQVLKGTQETKLSPAQLHDHLRRSMQGPGRTTPWIANPQAKQLVDPHVAVLQSQKQNADREVQAMQAAFGNDGRGAMGGPQITPAGGKGGGANYPGGPAGTTSTRAQNSTVPIVQRSSVPQGPMKTESASGGSSPGTGANPTLSTASQSSKSAATGPSMHPICAPNISSISGFPTALFSPILGFNPYTISGCGFGNQVGNVYLTGSFFAGKIPLTVQATPSNRRAPGHASWSDTWIVVSVDPKLSGEVNRGNVTLVVQPVGGAPIQKGGNEFLAAYEDMNLAPIPKSAVTFFQGTAPATGGKKTASSINTGNTTTTATLAETSTPDALYFSPSQTGMSADVFREQTIPGLEFFLTGSDLFDLSGLNQSFQLQPIFMQLHHDDPTGCATAGSWNAAWEGQKVRVTWEEFRCTTQWGTAIWSEYELNVMVKGPRGIDPWTGRPPLSLSAPSRVVPH